MNMKKGTLVTEKNMATILGHIKRALKNSFKVENRGIGVKYVKKANEILESSTMKRDYPWFEATIVGAKYIIHLSWENISKSVEIRDLSPEWRKFILIHNCSGCGNTIHIGDRIHIQANKIIIRKKNYTRPTSIEIWKFNRLEKIELEKAELDEYLRDNDLETTI